ncbi:MAG: S8 family serine peptidase [Verrucomicrobia bacterium]|nr:S8 family serine peptidase [Verrucomicrobiota bacterium]
MTAAKGQGPRSFTGVILALLLHWNVTASAQALRNTYTLVDGGQSRLFEVALDEVHVRSLTTAQTISVAPFAQADSVRTHAELLTQTTGNETEIVLYEAGQARGPHSRRVLTKQVLVRLAPGTVAGPLALAGGAVTGAELPHLPGHYLFTAAQTAGALNLSEWLRTQPGVMSAHPQLARQMIKRFVPNDTLFTNQWHLLNTGQNGGTAGADINVTNVWDTFRGVGVTIGIVDDGLQGTHVDLTNNVNFAIGFDYNFGDNDPSPDVANDFHGTAVAGVAAGRGNNGLGISGVAFEASLAGIRLIAAPTTDAQEASAMLHSNAVVFVSNNSWGPPDDARNLTAPGPQMSAALANGTANGRGGRGTIFLWAGGNGGEIGDNANYDGYANSIYTIAVGALNDRGQRASYSEPGANVVITAPAGNDATRPQGTSTTDLMGNNGYNPPTPADPLEYADRDYTSRFNGTSSATPVASGVVALLLQANPNLGWRDVQEVLMRSATVNRPADPDWFTNAAGFHFNHDFGAGLINVGAAVALGTNHVNLGTQLSYSDQRSALSFAIPDNDTNGVLVTFNVASANLRLEHVTLTANISHSSRGQVAIDLISPQGTVSRLAERHSDPNANISDWTYMTVRNWGELSDGNWTVRVSDRTPNVGGILNSLSLQLYGTFTNINQAPTNPPTITAQPRSRTVTQGSTLTFDVSITNNATPPLSYQWRYNNSDILGAVSPVLVLTNVQSSAEGLYSVRVSNPAATNFSADAALFVNAAPVVLAHPTNQSVIIGSNVTFSVVASGSAPFTYVWRRNGAPIIGATNQTYSITGVQISSAGIYDVLVANALASVFSSNAVLSVLPPFNINPQPLSIATNVGGSATLTVGAVGIGLFPGPFTYQWTFNGTPLAGQTSPSLAFTGLVLTNSGNYACVVGSPLGSITSSNGVLTVFNPFSVGTTAFQPGGLFQMTASGDDGRAYRLETSTNLVTWTPVVTNTVSGGTATFTDSTAAGKVLRFYRILLLP